MEKLKYIKPKLFSTMKTYTKEQFVKDIVAGIIVAIIALPSASSPDSSRTSSVCPWGLCHPNLLINVLPMRKHFTRLTG